jgi:hypothetical protein
MIVADTFNLQVYLLSLIYFIKVLNMFLDKILLRKGLVYLEKEL